MRGSRYAVEEFRVCGHLVVVLATTTFSIVASVVVNMICSIVLVSILSTVMSSTTACMIVTFTVYDYG